MEPNDIEIDGVRHAISGEVSLEYYSPFIDAEEIILQGDAINPRGNYTLPLEISGSSELARITKQAQLLQSKGPVLSFTGAILRSNGATIERGNIDITRIPRNLNNDNWKASGNFYNDAALFSDIVKDKKLRSLYIHYPIPVEGQNIDDIFNALHTQFGSNFVLTYNADSSISDIERAYRGFNIWAWYQDFHGLDYLQRTSLYANQINAGENPDGFNGKDYFCFPTYRAQFNGNESNSWNQLFNAVNPDTGLIEGCKSVFHEGGDNDFYTYTALRNQIVPMYYYHQILRHCFTEFGYTLEGAILDDPQFLKLILPNTKSILKEQVLNIRNQYGAGTDDTFFPLYTQDQTTIKASEHLPDMKIIDFVKDFMIKFNAHFKFDGKKVTIENNKLETINRDYTNMSPEIIIEQIKKTGTTVKYEFDSGDKSYDLQIALTETINPKLPENVDGTILGTIPDLSNYLVENFNSINFKDLSLTDDYVLKLNNLVPYKTGQLKEFSSELTPVEMGRFGYAGDNVPGYDAYLPYFEHEPTYYYLSVYTIFWTAYVADTYDFYSNFAKGTFDLNEGTDEKKIALYHGYQKTLKTNSTGSDFAYPYMSFHNYAPGDVDDPGHDVQLGNWHLGWIGEQGLIATFWRKFVNVFNNNRKVTFQLYVSWYDIKNHNWNEAYVIRGRTYYVSSIKFSMPGLMNGKPAIYECYEL